MDDERVFAEVANLVKLRKALIDGSYAVGEPVFFVVHEPKTRQIMAVPFVDRIVQHAINNVIEPIFDKSFVAQSFACRKTKGTHKAAIRTQSILRKHTDCYILKTDFRKYFASINREILHREIRRKISCYKTLGLIEKFISPSGTGLPIGNLLSQLGANIYGNIIDRWLLHKVRIKSFIRYMDDIVVFCRSVQAARLLQMVMAAFASHEMELGFSRWQIRKTTIGANFCGYRIFHKYKLLRRDSVIRAKRKIRKYDEEKLKKFIPSWLGHAMWADTHNLLIKLGVTQ